MRIETRKVYTAAELHKWRGLKSLSGAFERAFESYKNAQAEEGPACWWTGELMDSVKALFDAAGVEMADWSIGMYSPSYIRADFRGEYAEETEKLSGPRALAWIENNLLSGLRVPWTGPRRAELRKYGAGYYAGQVKPCPFTGICYDDDLLNRLMESIKAGDTLAEAFEGLAIEARKIAESEDEYEREEAYFLDHAAANGYEYDAKGARI